MAGIVGTSIAEQIKANGISRRRFIEFCAVLMVTGRTGLALTGKVTAPQIAKRIGASRRPSVIWLHFQDCTGCTESLLNTSRPDMAGLIFSVISLDYHETLMAASGYQAETVLRQAVRDNQGKFILVVEGAVPSRASDGFMESGGRPALAMLQEIEAQAALVVAIGSCASWGGIAAAEPGPTSAQGVGSILTYKPLVNLPGCPPNPYNFLSVVLEYTAMGRLPELDEYKRPKFAYDRLIHEHCPRRAHFDAGRFANLFGDKEHRQGWCLYKLGCKGPVTHGPCSALPFNEIPDVWPIGVGAPCAGCTEKEVGFRLPLFQTVDIHAATPPETYPPINASAGSISAAAAALTGAVTGAAATAALMASHHLPGGKNVRAIEQREGETRMPVTNDRGEEKQP